MRNCLHHALIASLLAPAENDVTRQSSTLAARRSMDYLHNTKSGVPVRVRRVIYTGHASTIFSVESAGQILDLIGQRARSEDVLPFALRLVEGDDCIEIAEDNNEFACGEALARCLDKFEGYNIMVCVSRYVEGCYVSDMIQQCKIRAVKEAATSALEALFGELKNEPSAFANDDYRQLNDDNHCHSGGSTYPSQPSPVINRINRAKSIPVILDQILITTSPQIVNKKANSSRNKLSKLRMTLAATR